MDLRFQEDPDHLDLAAKGRHEALGVPIDRLQDTGWTSASGKIQVPRSTTQVPARIK